MERRVCNYSKDAYNLARYRSSAQTADAKLRRGDAHVANVAGHDCNTARRDARFTGGRPLKSLQQGTAAQWRNGRLGVKRSNGSHPACPIGSEERNGLLISTATQRRVRAMRARVRSLIRGGVMCLIFLSDKLTRNHTAKKISR